MGRKFIAMFLILLPIFIYAQRIDVDLTRMSSTMAYAQLEHIMKRPMNYLNKSIKVSGLYQGAIHPHTGKDHHFILVVIDACCVQGMEFRMLGNYTYPDDYPAQETPIELVGIVRRTAETRGYIFYLEVENIVIK